MIEKVAGTAMALSTKGHPRPFLRALVYRIPNQLMGLPRAGSWEPRKKSLNGVTRTVRPKIKRM